MLRASDEKGLAFVVGEILRGSILGRSINAVMLGFEIVALSFVFLQIDWIPFRNKDRFPIFPVQNAPVCPDAETGEGEGVMKINDSISDFIEISNINFRSVEQQFIRNGHVLCGKVFTTSQVG